jgi:hypothetical protein
MVERNEAKLVEFNQLKRLGWQCATNIITCQLSICQTTDTMARLLTNPEAVLPHSH